jgi:hypothetical protein
LFNAMTAKPTAPRAEMTPQIMIDFNAFIFFPPFYNLPTIIIYIFEFSNNI